MLDPDKQLQNKGGGEDCSRGPDRMPAPALKPLPTREERRAKREAGRAKHREENVGRAAKMHTARLVWEHSARPQASAPATPSKAQVHVGCSGWFYWHWRDDFYPAGLPTKDWFRHYSKQFGTVELNAPFYSWPTVAAVRVWLRQIGRRKFVYTVKASEVITHVKRFAGTKTLIRDFGHIADLLGPRMGCFLFQLPPSFHYTPARLKRIVSQLDPARRNVVEFRHRSWWNDRVFTAFRAAGIIFCSCSAPRLPEELITTAEDIYLRFHGTKQWYRHDYTPLELATWAARIRISGAKRVWAYFNTGRL
jgi:uncharacterized protein YecE (DUF72 family)